MTLENRQFFVDEISRGGLVKPSVLVYAMGALNLGYLFYR